MIKHVHYKLKYRPKILSLTTLTFIDKEPTNGQMFHTFQQVERQHE